MKKGSYRYRHHFLGNGAILSVCTRIDFIANGSKIVRLGWSCFDPRDGTWIKKVGSGLSKARLDSSEHFYVMVPNEPVICDYVSLRALQYILLNSSETSDYRLYPQTRESLFLEMGLLLSNVMKRQGFFVF